ncbi:MAG TPA: LysR substrate-binding domain-containing protein [Rhodocyclaceae bacterium]|nr:LysR substrate-binding domain-containing protein [Rhodocyclaceae bacterium]
MKNVTLRQLRVFEAVARQLSFSRAAKELFLTQPAVSMQVRQLEESVGLPLYEQVGKRIRLTEAGELMAQAARRMAGEFRQVKEALAAMKGVEAGTLALAVVSTGIYFAPQLLARFSARHPGVRVRLLEANREQVLQSLAASEVDLAVMGEPPESSGLVAEYFADHPLGIVAPPGHPLVQQRDIDPAVLAAERFVMREAGSGTRRTMERFFSESGVTIQTGMEMTSNETAKQAVIAGLGLSFLSLHTVGLELSSDRLRVLDVRGLPVRRRWNLAWRQDKYLSPAAQAFRLFVAERGAELLLEAIIGSR